MYAIKKTTDNPTEAAEFVDYLLNSSDMNAIMGTTNGFPVSKSALETLESRDMLTGIEYESSQQISESEGLTAMSPYLENDEIINAFIEAAYSVCYDGKTSDEAADKAFEEISAIFSA
jgi:ABC-type glycerol-3-phosphate transport system substrate-binding protein